MQAELRQHKPEIDLAALYRRRKAVLALMRAAERYQRTPLRPIQRCAPQGPQAAA
jgi:hypothetical protein